MAGAMRRDVHIALLRGINVGGKHLLPMEDLVAMFRDAGCTDVRTYIQSGNVVFRAGTALAHRTPARIGEVIANRFGFEAPVVMRTAAELGQVARNNPLLKSGKDFKYLHVAFLADRPTRSRVEALDPDRSPPDEFLVRGREIYLHCPKGLGRSKLTARYFDSRLRTVSTTRNWRTVLKLLDLAGGAGSTR
jgi:uncharacterized protein (DUF1697 family)